MLVLCTCSKRNLDGLLIACTVVSAGEIDEVFVRRVWELMREVCGDREPHKAPSYEVCLHCPLTPEDCGGRVQSEKAYQGETDEF